MTGRPTWALIDDAIQALGVVEGFANTVASRRDGADERLARQVAMSARRAAVQLALVEREDETTED